MIGSMYLAQNCGLGLDSQTPFWTLIFTYFLQNDDRSNGVIRTQPVLRVSIPATEPLN